MLVKPPGRRYARNIGYSAAAGLGTGALTYLLAELRRRTAEPKSGLRPVQRQYSGATKKGGSITLSSRKGRKKKRIPKQRYASRKLDKDMRLIKSAISDLRKGENASLGTMIYRKVDVNNIACSSNVQAVQNWAANVNTNLESILDNLKFFDPSAPSTLISGVDGATGTYQRNYLIKDFTASLLLRNNYITDVDVRVYLCSPKDDTGLAPDTVWTQATAKESNVAYTDPNQYPTDYDFFNDLWKAKCVIKTVLKPNQQATVSHTEHDIEYDSSTYDSHNLAYQREFKSFTYLVVCKGTLAHDTVQDQQGLCPAGLDIQMKTTAKVKYDAGVNIKYYVQSNNYATPTNGFVQSHQPVADNQGYSLA